jgi:hypothetical protein
VSFFGDLGKEYAKLFASRTLSNLGDGMKGCRTQAT